MCKPDSVIYPFTELIQSYIRLLNFVQRNMPDKFRLADNGIDRLDLRVMIFREVISNTLLHREYETFPNRGYRYK